MRPKEVLDVAFPIQVKAELVARINTACRMVRDQCERDYAVIPNRGGVYGRSALHFYVDRLLTEAATKELLPFHPIEKKVKTNGYWFMQYVSNRVKWQIKRVRKRGELPKGSSFRIINSISNQVAWDFGPEYRIKSETDVPFAIVTYGHQNFYPTFIMVGMPEPDYSGWSENLDVTDVKVAGLEEKIYEENAPRLKIAFLESQSKTL